ncbi:hypothetical protein A3SI_05759 [Nitritalea halalkaliphila LW7]|uniref:Tetratricopeptide repeat protein n=1 Tax=Nitritalea halalkaliphila LW7 TaxID=1189621 RepID=I5C769_9BACT|nr:hypothetical protein [Nitritalea halalkaliphila]EIM77671.1 hypothetical protein A3SI_05759 [Nitritalea halalkaliphila LW7]
MKKPQIQIIGLVSAAVVTVGILYALPRVVVDNESEENFEQVAASSESASTPADMHGAEMDASTRKRMDELKASLQTEENKERFLTFADSLAVLYTRYGKFDSAAYVLGGAAEKFPAFPQHVAAGEAYYEAYTFALNEQKVQALATETRKFLGMALEEQPKRTDLKTKVAMTYVSSSNPMQGITMLREILEEDPMNEDACITWESYPCSLDSIDAPRSASRN